MRFFTVILGVMASVLLSACGAHQAGNASPEVVSQARYVHSGPPALTLFTMVNNRTGAGGHSSLMINGSQRVIFDPAGTVRHETVPERDDVLYGITPGVADFYTRAHARATHHVVVQRIVVSPEVAERALQLAIANGSVGQAQCALSVSAILRQLPGFQGVKSTWFPVKLSKSFGQVPGVVTERLYEYDDEDKRVALRAYDPQKVAAQNQ
ncbi:hypothetical protein [Primorskyibacter marinus]|uniref:hypothetical protein n=1 Tax=Primorskyibacter marinus TaxID=1977320 RepID=UPI0018E54C33|nr:hypothetical protein [Primorskyibacter marinus]